MKQTTLTRWTAVAMLLATACTTDKTVNPDAGKIAVEFTATTPQSRITLDDGSDAGSYSCAWESSDRIAVYANSQAPAEFTYDAAADLFRGSLANETTTTWRYQAIYPYNAADPSVIPFGNVRPQTGNTFNSAFDPLVSEVREYTGTTAGKDNYGDPVSFRFNRMTAILKFEFNITDGGVKNEPVRSITLNASTPIAAEGFAIDPATMTGSLTGNPAYSITISYDEATAPKASHAVAYFNIPAGTTSLTSITVNTANYTRTLPLNRSEKEYKAGTLYHGATDIPGGWLGYSEWTAYGNWQKIQSSSEGNGIDLMLMGDYYAKEDIVSGAYTRDMHGAIEAFFRKEPCTSFRHLFNIYINTVATPDSNTSSFHCWFTQSYVDPTLGPVGSIGLDSDNQALWEAMYYPLWYATSSDRYRNMVAIVILNKDAYAGRCMMFEPDYGDPSLPNPAVGYFTASSVTSAFEALLWHEGIGHGLGKLGDEYMSERYDEGQATFYKNQQNNYGWLENVSFVNDADACPWAIFLDDERYKSENLGLYEGGCTFSSGAWRPSNSSIMFNSNYYRSFNAPSRRAIYNRIQQLAYGKTPTYEEFVAYDAKNRAADAAEAATYTPMVMRPLPHTPPTVVAPSASK